jgi:hypothetical protein
VSSSIVETLRDFFGTNRMSLSATHATLGITRSFTHFSHAIAEIRRARVYGGIHFMSADAQAGRAGEAGRQVSTGALLPAGNLMH